MYSLEIADAKIAANVDPECVQKAKVESVENKYKSKLNMGERLGLCPHEMDQAERVKDLATAERHQNDQHWSATHGTDR